MNKQYTPEEYKQLLPKVIEQMYAVAYVDGRGVEYRYGEFFPSELSPFSYNETIAQDYYPTTKEEAEKSGFSWREGEGRNYQVSMKTGQTPDDIKNVDDSILKEVIECAHKGNCAEQCAGAFKLIPLELQYYRQWGVPLPRLCPSCRHFGRVKQKTPLRLWQGKCRCAGNAKHAHGATACTTTFMTPYAPERKEIIYCEACYNAEIV